MSDDERSVSELLRGSDVPEVCDAIRAHYFDTAPGPSLWSDIRRVLDQIEPRAYLDVAHVIPIVDELNRLGVFSTRCGRRALIEMCNASIGPSDYVLAILGVLSTLAEHSYVLNGVSIEAEVDVDIVESGWEADPIFEEMLALGDELADS